MSNHKWTYPNSAAYYHAMASLAVSEANVPYFLERAAGCMTPTLLNLASHNIGLLWQAQSDAIGFASKRD